MSYNQRPADFPTDAEVADARHVQQACGVIAAGVEAMMDEDDFYIWSRSIPGTKHTLTATMMGAQDGRAGILFAPELYFVPGTREYRAYVHAYARTSQAQAVAA